MVNNEIGEIKKNSNKSIKINLTEFNNKKGIDIREYIESDKYTGPTKSGIRIPIENIKILKEIFELVDINKDIETYGSIPKTSTSKININKIDYNGEISIDLREYVESEKYTGPTKAGVRIPINEFDKLKTIINNIE